MLDARLGELEKAGDGSSQAGQGRQWVPRQGGTQSKDPLPELASPQGKEAARLQPYHADPPALHGSQAVSQAVMVPFGGLLRQLAAQAAHRSACGGELCYSWGLCPTSRPLGELDPAPAKVPPQVSVRPTRTFSVTGAERYCRGTQQAGVSAAGAEQRPMEGKAKSGASGRAGIATPGSYLPHKSRHKRAAQTQGALRPAVMVLCRKLIRDPAAGEGWG